MQKKTIFFVVAILCIMVAGWGYYLYQKPRTGVEDQSTDYTISAVNLYQEFVTDEAAATKKYVNKVLKVQGTLYQIDSLQGKISLLLRSQSSEGGVNCSLSKPGNVPSLGETLTVKGRCVGFLMDVNLVDAVIDK